MGDRHSGDAWRAGNRRTDDRGRQGPSPRARRVRRDDPPRLRPTGVVLFATIDDGVSARVASPYHWNSEPYPETRNVGRRAGTLPWRHPKSRRLQEAFAWLLGR